MTGVLDWLGRVAMLVLAGMVTLSIIGSIAAIPSGDLDTRIGLEPQDTVTGAEDIPAGSEGTRPAPLSGDQTSAANPSAGAAAAPSDRPDLARWLEAITYALLALVGLAALATLLLWRGLRERRRMADALEEMAARR